MKRAALLTLAVCLSGQEAEIRVLEPQDTAALRRLYAAKIEADHNWERARAWVERKYTTTPGIAESGGARVEVFNPAHGWEHGALFNRDLDAIIPRPPADAASSSFQSPCSSSFEHVNTIPEKPWL